MSRQKEVVRIRVEINKMAICRAMQRISKMNTPVFEKKTLKLENLTKGNKEETQIHEIRDGKEDTKTDTDESH